ncbi:hypothetical protein [Paraburkholderia phenazinium]|jgi:hypothetical protein|uniref:Uncharacterized protein n=1 Tax=Paraburkholderia phenazinium TaxID=60549 RepID=A0A1G7RFW2_9BURK|nr:hypothetical protein [Paraburkholderia phenazinium]SDG09716.1 hypothetical protein SAMN05216466_10294 [Paraburkholderia phenazinium]
MLAYTLTEPVDKVARHDAGPSRLQSCFYCRDGRALPLHGSMDAVTRGTYLGLFHGRDSLDAKMGALGFQGPAIGPLRYVRTAYGAHLYLGFEDPAIAQLFFPDFEPEVGRTGSLGPQYEVSIDLEDGMIAFDGRFFGDWSVFYHHGS